MALKHVREIMPQVLAQFCSASKDAAESPFDEPESDAAEIELRIARSDLETAIVSVTPGGPSDEDAEAWTALNVVLACQRRVYASRQHEDQAA